MSDETERKDAAPTGTAETAAATEANAPKAAVFEAVELEAARAEAAEHKDRLLRTLAEMENLRRRTEKEVKDARDYAVTGFARDLLSVTDTFERAFAALPAEVRETDTAVKAFVDGIDMTLARIDPRHGEGRHQEDRRLGRQVRPEPASGHVRTADGRTVRRRRPGAAGRLRHR